MAQIIKTKIEFEGQFFDKVIVVEGDDISPWQDDQEFKLVGKPLPRVDGVERVTGNALFPGSSIFNEIGVARETVGNTSRSLRFHADP